MTAPHLLGFSCANLYNSDMYYVYILQSRKNNSIYIGFSENLKSRFHQHNNGTEKSTKSGVPWELIYYEAFKDKTLAQQIEKSLKYYGKAWGQLKRRVGL